MPKSGQLLIMRSITKLCIYSQNVHKNYALVDTFLESQKDYYDIFFVQELFFFFFCSKIYNAVLDRSPWQTIYNK